VEGSKREASIGNLGMLFVVMVTLVTAARWVYIDKRVTVACHVQLSGASESSPIVRFVDKRASGVSEIGDHSSFSALLGLIFGTSSFSVRVRVFDSRRIHTNVSYY
jgi:hypothetical protein